MTVRRLFVLVLFTAICGFSAFASVGSASNERRLRLYHTHTGEHISVTYQRDGRYVTKALSQIDEFLRDHRTGEVHRFDPALFDLLSDLTAAVGRADAEIHVACGYRTPWSNNFLRVHRQ